MSDLARQLEQLAQSKGEEMTPKAKKTAGPSRSTRAKPAPSVAQESQAEQEDEEDESESRRKRPRTAKATAASRAEPATRRRRRRGEVPPQVGSDGVVLEERDFDKVVSNLTPIAAALLIPVRLQVRPLSQLKARSSRVSLPRRGDEMRQVSPRSQRLRGQPFARQEQGQRQSESGRGDVAGGGRRRRDGGDQAG